MHRILLLLTILAVVAAIPAEARSQEPYGRFTSPADSIAIIRVVEGYLSVTDSTMLDSATASRWVTSTTFDKIMGNRGLPLRFPSSMPWRITGAHLLGYNDSVAIVTLAAQADTLPRFGPMAVDWVYFLVRTPAGWRITTFERQRKMENTIDKLRALDTSTAYPSSLKPIIVREISGLLMSNAQIRSFFAGNRAKFNTIPGLLAQEPRLRRLARIDRKAGQINNINIEWSGSAQAIPQEVINEFMTSASPEERQQFREEITYQEKLRRIGDDTVKAITKRLKIRSASVDRLLAAMYDVRINFLNRDLPWKDAVQLTLGGDLGYTVGLIHSPKKELPLVSPAEYYYLEDLGEGWWIFRAK